MPSLVTRTVCSIGRRSLDASFASVARTLLNSNTLAGHCRAPWRLIPFITLADYYTQPPSRSGFPLSRVSANRGAPNDERNVERASATAPID